MELIASTLVYAGLVLAAAGALNLLRPWRWLGVRRRRAGAATLVGGIVLVATGMALPVGAHRSATAGSLLDAAMPVWQFDERHAIGVAAPRDRVYAAVQEVSADEIRLFRTLTWIRSPTWPWRRRPASLMAPPARQPILAVALRSGFVPLGEEPGREMVVGAVVCCRPEDARRLVPRLREGGAAAFRALSEPRLATAAMNFALEDDPAGGTRLTTETRVRATDAQAARRFAVYWRVIHPGSSLIRSMWLRAIKARAEAPAPRVAPDPGRAGDRR